MKISKIEDNKLEQICNIIGDTADGLTGSEISHVLYQAGIKDTDPNMTKRYRIFNALKAKQNVDGCANHIINFIQIVKNMQNILRKS